VPAYSVWGKSYTGKRLIDVWGLFRHELAQIPHVELVIGPNCWSAYSIMVDTQHTKSTVDHLAQDYGAVDIAAVPKSSST
jgi:hypothetical protein